jgi:hypothetical protein
MYAMIRATWSNEKNNQLKADPNRSICFEDILVAIENDGLLADINHPNSLKYPHQRILVVAYKGYGYAVPYVRHDDGTIFLKTIYPSRTLTRLYLTDEANET